jgi:hypothetical protein
MQRAVDHFALLLAGRRYVLPPWVIDIHVARRTGAITTTVRYDTGDHVVDRSQHDGLPHSCIDHMFLAAMFNKLECWHGRSVMDWAKASPMLRAQRVLVDLAGRQARQLGEEIKPLGTLEAGCLPTAMLERLPWREPDRQYENHR